MPIEYKVHNLFAVDRISVRKEVVELFLEENFGKGKKELASKYIYTVEKIDKYEILLQRPASLNKGFDFVVKINGVYFSINGKKRHKNPSHDDILNILNQVRNRVGCEKYQKVKDAINEIYEIKNPDFCCLSEISFVDCDGNTHPITILLFAIKWLFIEQDITYWNYSGRAMLMNKLWEQKLA